MLETAPNRQPCLLRLPIRAVPKRRSRTLLLLMLSVNGPAHSKESLLECFVRFRPCLRQWRTWWHPICPGSPEQYDSVEYASVRTPSDRPQPPPPQVSAEEAPLLDAPALQRIQQMTARAPLLYPSVEFAGNPQGPVDPGSPSTSSSELPAEVSRQLNELMAVRDEESTSSSDTNACPSSSSTFAQGGFEPGDEF